MIIQNIFMYILISVILLGILIGVAVIVIVVEHSFKNIGNRLEKIEKNLESIIKNEKKNNKGL